MAKQLIRQAKRVCGVGDNEGEERREYIGGKLHETKDGKNLGLQRSKSFWLLVRERRRGLTKYNFQRYARTGPWIHASFFLLSFSFYFTTYSCNNGIFSFSFLFFPFFLKYQIKIKD